MSVRAEALAAQYLRDWLLLNLPGKAAEVNAARAPFLVSPYAGPYEVTSGMALQVSLDGLGGTFVPVALTTGTRAATDIAADINGTVGLAGVAGTDSAGRFVLTGVTAPTADTQAIAVRDVAEETGAAALFGWNPGGEQCVRAPLVPPLGTGVCDGWPLLLDCGPGFWVIIGKRTSVPVNPGDVRRDEHQVGLELTVFLKDTNIQNSRSREGIEACVQCLREVLLSSTGRCLGRAGFGDVQKLEERTCVIPGLPFKAHDEAGGVLGIFDTASYVVSVRVFERPALS